MPAISDKSSVGMLATGALSSVAMATMLPEFGQRWGLAHSCTPDLQFGEIPLLETFYQHQIASLQFGEQLVERGFNVFA